MPTRNRSEKVLISLFLSAYENDTWQGCNKDWLDERQDGAVEILATRLSDGATLAIEHTLIQPYSTHKQETARFNKVFRPIQIDRTLIVPNRGVDVFLPSGTLVEGHDWNSICLAVHGWLREHVCKLPVGKFNPKVALPEARHCRLLIRVMEEQGFDGDFRLGIDGSQLPDSLRPVVKKALITKVGKLADTGADKRILLLERDEVTLREDLVAAEIEGMRHGIEKFDKVHEIWFVENVPYSENSDFVRFSVRDNGRATKVLAFYKGLLHRRYGS